MQRAAAIVDAVAPAQRVEAGLGAGKTAARQGQRVDRPGFRQRGDTEAREFRVEEPHVEVRIVDDQRRVADEGQEIVGDGGEHRLVGEKIVGQPMHRERLLRHRAFRIDVELPLAVRPVADDVVDQLDTADLDDPVALIGAQPGGLGIQDDLTHGDPFCLAASRAAGAANGGRASTGPV